LAELRELEPALRVIRRLLLGRRERDTPAAALVVAVRVREPVAEQAFGALEKLLAAQQAAVGLVGVEPAGPEGAVERGQVRDM
jgi:hypothetical protein